MECLKCNGTSKVIESTKKYGTVYRKRKCDACGEIFFTQEVYLEEDNKVKVCVNALTKRYDKYKQRNKEKICEENK